MTNIDELTSALADEIQENESRKRRSASTQASFEYAIHKILEECWRGLHISHSYLCGIHKRSNWYSELARYRDPKLTYKQTMAAYDGLIKLGLVVERKGGHFDPETGRGDITKFKPSKKLIRLLEQMVEDPFKSIQPNLDDESIVLRDKIGGIRQVVDYVDTDQTVCMRKNLRRINACLLRHWIDLEITDDAYAELQNALIKDTEKSPIDFSKRTLVRIFSKGSFEQGGRFYRGWWQNVPSELRKHITIDSKRSCEYDYSQLNPHMIYFLAGTELGSEDAYGRVYDGEHREVVKAAFNAMVQASTPLTRKPKDIDLTEFPYSWKELKQAILDAHKPITGWFFHGRGNHLQFIDSCIAENVMLHFVKQDQPVLPVHDSFIMHYAFGEMGELEEQMRRAFFDYFARDIPIKGEIGQIKKTSFSGRTATDFTIEELAKGPGEFSLWERRNC